MEQMNKWKQHYFEGIALLKRERVWLLPTIVALLFIAFHRSNDRFEMTNRPWVAFDRKTGQLCNPDNDRGSGLPLCSDLAKWWRW
jgi:hypothetical protein